jgi:hypothetical protein
MVNPPPRQADKPDFIKGLDGERYTARIVTGPLPSVIFMADAPRCVISRKVTV